MPEIEIKDKANQTVGKMNLSDKFAVKANTGLLHDSVVNYLANQRQGTHATKTKGLISGGGKKPYKQKHTGRARAGSSRSPIWRGGGTIFGPQPRDYSYDLNKQAKKVSLLGAISSKIEGGEVIVVDGFDFTAPKTKDMTGVIKSFDIAGKSLLIIIPEKDRNVWLSARNIPGVKVSVVDNINTYDVLVHDRLMITKAAVEKLEVKA